ncbi:malonyl-ACP O-methyltransferase BioC [Acinetobacter sp. Ver3]|uniref:malonyl-ACP O-methyltransferase BioC n=2 Tax=unclassified Acinetobacter TaxID=196816 RepID=UPI000B0BF4AE|nr:malonyl-ACP O-methyltransferase BioC [Acinetobacter sp. Ver3]
MNDSMLNKFIQKEMIATRFAKSHWTYADQARIQQNVAKHLSELMRLYVSSSELAKVFEIGCGTGNLTQEMLHHFKMDQVILNDLYADVEHTISHHQPVEWRIGDVEKIELPKDLDLCASSSALQWMSEFERLIQKIYSALKPNGYFCFSTYGPQNLKEIKSLTGQGLKYFDQSQIKSLLEQNGFEVMHCEQQLAQLHFAHPKLVLKHLQATGVTATSQGFRWTKESLNQFYLGYRQFIATDEQENLVYPLTYHPIFFIARSKS